MERKCANCGVALPREAAFCAQCGMPCNATPAGSVKKLKWWMIVAPVVAVLVVAAIVVGMMWDAIFLRMNPVGALSRAFVNTVHDLNQRKEGTLGQCLSGLVDEDGRYTNEIDIDFDYESYMSLDVSLVSQTDVRNKQTSLTLDGVLGLMNYYSYDLDIALYADGDCLAVNWEQISGKDFYGVNYDSFEEDLQSNEGLKALLSEDDWKECADFLDLLSQLLDDSHKDEDHELSTEYIGVVFDFLKDHRGTVGSREISLTSGRQNCDTVTFTVTNEELYDLAVALLEVAEKDEGLKAMTFANVSIESTDTDTLWDTYMDECYDWLEALDSDGTSVLCFCLYDNRVVYLDASFQGEEREVTVSVLLGENSAQDDITILLTTDGADADLEMEVTLSTEVEAGKVSESIDLALAGSGEDIQLTLGYDWDKEDEELKLSWKQNVNGYRSTYEAALELCLDEDGITLKLPELFSLLEKISPDLVKQYEGSTCYVTVTSSHGAKIQEPDFINIRDIPQNVLDALEEKFS